MTIVKPVLARVVAIEEPADIVESQRPFFARVRATHWLCAEHARRRRQGASRRRTEPMAEFTQALNDGHVEMISKQARRRKVLARK